MANHVRLGGLLVPGGAAFTVWAPFAKSLELRLLSGPRAGTYPLADKGGGLWVAMVEGATAGDRYLVRADGQDQPDPCSRFQPEGVHGPSELVDFAALEWKNAGFRAPPLEDVVIYELHVGTFTEGGTFDAAIAELKGLRDLGFTAVEVMPIGEFPGQRNWGYDGVQWFAAQSSYGGPRGFARFVDAAHGVGLAVLLDVVFNHLGPEGNYLARLGPYFTHRHKTPWGVALNYDGPDSRYVRELALQSATFWLEEFHLDGLRLDAVTHIVDHSPTHLLREMSERIHALSQKLGRPLYTFAETDENEARLIQPWAEGGYGMTGTWSDDFHHALHAVLTGERDGYYADYGSLEHLARALRQGFSYEGEWSQYHNRPRGTVGRREPVGRFVVNTQNHDQIGNRPRGERLISLVDPRAERLATSLLVVGPGTPLFFMGQEYGERSPFFYFTHHGDPELAAAVSRSRAEEAVAHGWPGQSPDPQDPATFVRSKIDRARREHSGNRETLRLTHDLLEWRRKLPALRDPKRADVTVEVDERKRVLVMRRGEPKDQVMFVGSFSADPVTWEGYVPEGRWQLVLDAQATSYGGEGAPAAPQQLRGGFIELALPPFAARLYRAE